MNIIVINLLPTTEERLLAAKKADDAYDFAKKLLESWNRTTSDFRNPEKAMVTAAELGHPIAQEECAWRFREGTGGFHQDLNAAYRWQRHLAQTCDGRVGFLVDLARYYTDGLGPIEKNDINFKIGVQLLYLAHERFMCQPGHGGGEYETIGSLMRLIRHFAGELTQRQKDAVWKSLKRGDYIINISEEKKHFRRRR